MATGLGLQLAADYGTIDKDTPSYNPMPDINNIPTIEIDGANFLPNPEGSPIAIVIGSHESNYTEPFEVTSRVSFNVGLPQPVVQEYKRKFWLAVALAPYRSFKKWGQYGVNLDGVVKGRALVGWKLAPNNTAPDSDHQHVSSQSTQEHMDAGWEAVDTHWWTSKQSTDGLVRRNDTEAAKFCRTISVVQGSVNVAMDLPNIDCLMRIYQARQYIDSKDPTLKISETYRKWNLTQWLFGRSYDKNWPSFAWSSSPFWASNNSEAFKSWFVIENGSINIFLTSHTRQTSGGVIPVLEIPAI